MFAIGTPQRRHTRRLTRPLGVSPGNGTQSAVAMRPPGLSTRCASAKNCSRVSKWNALSSATTLSALPASSGNAVADDAAELELAHPQQVLLAEAEATIHDHVALGEARGARQSARQIRARVR